MADLEAMRARDFSALSPAVRARTERLAESTAGGQAVTERWTFYPKGVPTTVNAVISSLTLEDGRVVLLFEADGVSVGQEELRAVEALRHTSNMITLFDGAGQPLFSNPAAFTAYGQNCPFEDRFLDLDAVDDPLTRVLDDHVIDWLREVRTMRGLRFHQIDARRVLDPVSGEPSILLSERDVTAQIETERAKLAAEKRAEVAEAKERFLANMSHELRTPLTSVLGYAKLLGAGGLSEAQAGYLERIVGSGEVLATIIDDLIALTELSSGTVAVASGAFDPAQMLWEEMCALEPSAAAKGIELELDIAEEEPFAVTGDGERLRSVIRHYLSNAVKFTDAGLVSAAMSVNFDRPQWATIEVSVKDTGVGIAPAVQPYLFDRFTLADDGVGKRFAGRGLGLAICKETLALFGGELGVESAPGEGSRFWFRLSLPLAEADAGASSDTDQTEEPTAPLTVLYADDHENNRVLVRSLLESQGHRCEVVEDGAQAVVAAAAHDYDLILMDIQMPVQDGVSATLAIRAMNSARSAAPILALTANTLDAQLQTYAAAGMDDVIEKPINVSVLFQKVAHWGALGRSDGAYRLAI